MKKTALLSAMFFLVLTSCRKAVDAGKLLDVQEKVSIIGYISPSDTVLRIHVSKALPSIGTSISSDQENTIPVEFLITDAIVTISNENGDSALLDYDPESNFYLTDATNLRIEEESSYFLKVTVAGKEYNASCTVPKKIAEINETISESKDEFDNDVLLVNLSFQDFTGNNDFYILGGSFDVTFEFEGEQPEIFSTVIDFDTDKFKTDNVSNEGMITGSAEVLLGSSDNTTEASLKLQLANVEEILFQNLRTISVNEDAGDTPFVEYAITPDNILDEGAVGVFAGYSLTEKVIELN